MSRVAGAECRNHFNAHVSLTGGYCRHERQICSLIVLSMSTDIPPVCIAVYSYIDLHPNLANLHVSSADSIGV